MKSTIAFQVSLMLCTGSVLLAQEQKPQKEGPMLEVTAAQTEIKVSEDGRQRVIGTVPKGTRLWCFEIKGDFCRVMDPKTKQKGWIWQKHIRNADDYSEQKLAVMDRFAKELAEAPTKVEMVTVRERIVEHVGKDLGVDHPQYANSLKSLAELHESMGAYGRAEPLYRKTMEVRKKTLGEQHSSYGTSLLYLGQTYLKLGDYGRAEPLLKHGVEIYRKALGEEHPAYATSLNNLANLYDTMGDYKRTESLYKQALEIKRKALGEEHPAYATSLENLAILYTEMSDYARAEPLYRKTLEIRKTALGEEHRDYATSLNNLGMLYDNMGDYGRAETFYRQALKIRKTTLGEEHPDYATSLNNLGLLYCNMRDYAGSEPLLKQAVKIGKTTLGEEHPGYTISLGNLARLYHNMGNYGRAERLYRQVIDSQKKSLGEEHRLYATSLSNLGSLYDAMGDYARAEPLSKLALEIRKKVLGETHPDYATSLNNLAALQVRFGDAESATQSFEKARRSVASHVTGLLPSLPEKRQAVYLENMYKAQFLASLNAGIQFDEARVSSASWLVNGKAVSQTALASRQLLTRDMTDPNLAPLVGELREIRTKLANLAMSVAGPEKTKGRQQAIDELTAQEDKLAQQLSQATGVTQQRQPWVELQQVCDALPQSGALVDIARVRELDFKAKKAEQWKSAMYVAWITTRSGAVTIVDLGSADEIDQLVKTARTNLQNSARPDGALKNEGEDAATQALKKDLKALSDRVWAPLVPHLNDIDHVVLSPDGALWLAPWNALPVTNDGEYLIEKYQLRYVTSARDLVRQPAEVQPSAPAMLANPLFDQQANNKKSALQAIFKNLPADDGTATRGFTARSVLPSVLPLPNTAIEAMATQPSIEKYAGLKATLYKDRYALECVAKALTKPRVVSFATHGFFLPTQEAKLDELSGLQATVGEETRSATLDQEGKPIENPLLRCGLLLAGCNNRDASVAGDDGVLTGMEIVGIDLRGTELVVLSACETGIGDVRNGEGVAGLRQAFQLAGAEAVVSTLWQVPDRDSALLMKSFFEELANGATTAEALRTAQIQRIEKRRQRYGAAHPFFWAAFTLTGR